jgi:phosphomannomutase
LIEGIRHVGVNVVRVGIGPATFLNFSIFEYASDGSIMVTAGTESAQFNGYQGCVGRETLTQAQIEKLRATMEELATQFTDAGERPPGAQRKGWVDDRPLRSGYREYILRHTRPRTNPDEGCRRVILSTASGTGGAIVPYLFQDLGAIAFFRLPGIDGRWPELGLDDYSLRETALEVRKRKADFALAFNGDASQMIVLDDAGYHIPAQDIEAILSTQPDPKNDQYRSDLDPIYKAARIYQILVDTGGPICKLPKTPSELSARH